jgi:hypothetical protein
MRPIKLVIVAILGSDEKEGLDECMNVDFRSNIRENGSEEYVFQREEITEKRFLAGIEELMLKCYFHFHYHISLSFFPFFLFFFFFDKTLSHLSYFHHFRVIYLLLFL